MDPREALKRWRGEKSLAKAGAEIGCDPSLLRKLEDGIENRKPGLELAIRIRDRAGIAIEAWTDAGAPSAKTSAESGEHGTVEPAAEPGAA